MKRKITIEVEGKTVSKLESATAQACEQILAGYKTGAGSTDDMSTRYMFITSTEKKSKS